MGWQRHNTWAVAAIVLLAGCTPAQRTLYVLSGAVYDDATGKPVDGAVVLHAVSKVSVNTRADGSFAMSYENPPKESVVVKVSSPGFVTRWVRVFENPPARGSLSVNLRPVGVLTQITLPTGSDASVHIPIQRGDSRLDLAIPADALVRADGTAVSGNANVSLTYWNPNERTDSVPGLLFAEAREQYTTPVPLKTYGMADIEIIQGDDVLQVAANRTLTLTVTQPASFQAFLAANPKTLPQLYSLDRATGLWHLEATQVDGSGLLAYDAPAGVFTAQLKHLSDWNLDDLDPTLGGCVTGQIVDQCGDKVGAGVDLRIFMLAWEELHEFAGVKTAADGTFCKEIGSRQPRFGTNQSHIYVSGSDPANSDMCAGYNPPFPKNCLECSTSLVNGGCCRYEIDFQVPNGAAKQYSGHNQDGQGTCGYDPAANVSWDPFQAAGLVAVTGTECHTLCANPAPIDVTPCHFCGGSTTAETACQVNSLPIAKGDSTCNNVGTITLTIPGVTCAPKLPSGCTAWLSNGASCSETPQCCGTGTVCLDQLCVPNADP